MASIATAKVLHGPGAWEVDRLYLPRGGEPTTHLLELLTQQVARQGGQRIFLRVAADSPIKEWARPAGFFPSHEELLLECYSEGTRGPEPYPEGIVDAAANHQYGLFQLYSASTPANVRQALGITFAEWDASREWPPGQAQELICEKDGKVRGWLRVSRYGGTTHTQLMTHPDEADLLPLLVEWSLSQRGRHLWLVPPYQDYLVRLLNFRGFKEIGNYSTLVKTLAARVKRPRYATMEAIV